jgi:hypothetical protein
MASRLQLLAGDSTRSPANLPSPSSLPAFVSSFLLQLRSGFDGEWLADLFLKDYTQYSTSGYYIDSVTIPRAKFNALVANKPNGVNKEFSFSLWVPPGSGENIFFASSPCCELLRHSCAGVIILRSIVVGYPVATASDASMFDDGSSSPTNFFYSAEPQTGSD